MAEFEKLYRKPEVKRVNQHYLNSGDFFTQEQWRDPLAPWVDRLVAKPGGLLSHRIGIEVPLEAAKLLTCGDLGS